MRLPFKPKQDAGRNTPRAPNGRTRLVISMRCAVTCRDFTVSFRANSLKNGTYFVERVAAVSADTPSGSSGADARAIEVETDKLPFSDVKCPLCQSAVVVRCGKCRTLMCKGRVKRNVFHCSDNCGDAEPLAAGGLDHVSAHQTQCHPLLPRPSTPQLPHQSIPLIEKRR